MTFLELLRARLVELLAQRRGLEAGVERVYRTAGVRAFTEAETVELAALRKAITDVDVESAAVCQRIDMIEEALADVADAARVVSGRG